MDVMWKSSFWAHVSVALAFLCYLFAGASFGLPAKPECSCCSMTQAAHGEGKPHHDHAGPKADGVKAGDSCPLSHGSHSGHDRHISQHQAVEQIVMCPQGYCLLYPGEGEVVSIAKFLAPPTLFIATGPGLKRPPDLRRWVRPDLFRPPPDHPPSVLYSA